MKVGPHHVDAIVDAAQKAVWGYTVVISNGGTGWQRHVEGPLWELRLCRSGQRRPGFASYLHPANPRSELPGDCGCTSVALFGIVKRP